MTINLTFIKSAVDILRKNQPAAVLVLLTVSGFAAAFALQPEQEGRRNFTVCLSHEPIPAECQMPLRVSVLKSAEPLSNASNYLTAMNATFTVKFPTDERLLEYSSPYSEAWINFAAESFSDRYERFAEADQPGSLRGYSIHREMGSLIAIKETKPGDAGTEFLVPANGDKSIFMDCVKPFLALAGNIVTDTGCLVQTQLEPHVFVRYGFHRKYLHDWETINAHVMNKVRTAMTIHKE